MGPKKPWVEKIENLMHHKDKENSTPSVDTPGWGLPKSCSVRDITFAWLAFKNSSSRSASAADAATHFRIEKMMCMYPLSLIG